MCAQRNIRHATYERARHATTNPINNHKYRANAPMGKSLSAAPLHDFNRYAKQCARDAGGGLLPSGCTSSMGVAQRICARNLSGNVSTVVIQQSAYNMRRPHTLFFAAQLRRDAPKSSAPAFGRRRLSRARTASAAVRNIRHAAQRIVIKMRRPLTHSASSADSALRARALGAWC
jgi:hypothetical protein